MVPPSSWQISPCPTTDAGGLGSSGLTPRCCPRPLQSAIGSSLKPPNSLIQAKSYPDSRSA